MPTGSLRSPCSAFVAMRTAPSALRRVGAAEANGRRSVGAAAKTPSPDDELETLVEGIKISLSDFESDLKNETVLAQAAERLEIDTSNMTWLEVAKKIEDVLFGGSPTAPESARLLRQHQVAKQALLEQAHELLDELGSMDHCPIDTLANLFQAAEMLAHAHETSVEEHTFQVGEEEEDDDEDEEVDEDDESPAEEAAAKEAQRCIFASWRVLHGPTAPEHPT